MNQKNITETTRASSIVITIVLLAVLGFIAAKVHANGDVVCTLDAKKCPDGTYVSRVAPDCEFAPCGADNTAPDVKKDDFSTLIKEKRELLRKQTQERKQIIDNAKEDSTTLRSDDGTKEDFKELRTETHQNMEELLSEQKKGHASLHDENMEMLRETLSQKKEAMRSRINARKEERVAKVQEYKAKLDEKTQERLGGFIDRIVNRMNAVVSRLEQIIARVSTRIQKMEDNGADLTDAKAKLDDAGNFIADARDAIALLESVSADVITSETPKEQASEIREAAKVAKDSIKAVHTALMEVVRIIKASATDTSDDGDSTADSETGDATE